MRNHTKQRDIFVLMSSVVDMSIKARPNRQNTNLYHCRLADFHLLSGPLCWGQGCMDDSFKLRCCPTPLPVQGPRHLVQSGCHIDLQSATTISYMYMKLNEQEHQLFFNTEGCVSNCIVDLSMFTLISAKDWHTLLLESRGLSGEALRLAFRHLGHGLHFI